MKNTKRKNQNSARQQLIYELGLNRDNLQKLTVDKMTDAQIERLERFLVENNPQFTESNKRTYVKHFDGRGYLATTSLSTTGGRNVDSWFIGPSGTVSKEPVYFATAKERDIAIRQCKENFENGRLVQMIEFLKGA